MDNEEKPGTLLKCEKTGGRREEKRLQEKKKHLVKVEKRSFICR